MGQTAVGLPVSCSVIRRSLEIEEKNVSEVLCGLLLQGNECGNISNSDHNSNSGMNVKIWSSSKQGVSTDDEYVSNDSDMKHDTGIKFDIESPHFPFRGRPDLNFDLEDPNNPMEYFKLLIVEVISGETNTCPPGFIKHA